MTFLDLETSRPSDEPKLWLVQQAFLEDLVGGDSRTPEEREAPEPKQEAKKEEKKDE